MEIDGTVVRETWTTPYKGPVLFPDDGLPGLTAWSGDSSIPWRPLVLGIVAGALLLVSLIMLHRRYTLRLLLAARHARARTATAAHRARGETTEDLFGLVA